MAKLNIAPTKSNLISVKSQLNFAQDGFDLLEQKRQILVYELMSRLGRAKDIEKRIAKATKPAYASLHGATLAIGAAGLENAAASVKRRHRVTTSEQNVMGIKLPKVEVESEPFSAPFGIIGTSSETDDALKRFSELVPLLAELAEIENSVLRLARELRKTQRRCNALSRIFIPEYTQTAAYISGSLEERDREDFVILSMVKKRLEERKQKEGENEI